LAAHGRLVQRACRGRFNAQFAVGLARQNTRDQNEPFQVPLQPQSGAAHRNEKVKINPAHLGRNPIQPIQRANEARRAGNTPNITIDDTSAPTSAVNSPAGSPSRACTIIQRAGASHTLAKTVRWAEDAAVRKINRDNEALSAQVATEPTQEPATSGPKYSLKKIQTQK
jgi:hypothetical protein